MTYGLQMSKIDQLPDRAVFLLSDISMSLARLLFWTISHYFMEITHDALEKCKLSFPYPDQRATTATTPVALSTSIYYVGIYKMNTEEYGTVSK